MRPILFCIIFLLKSFTLCGRASICFLIADLMYNETDGIKYCEIQQGSVSTYSGETFISGGRGRTQKNFIEFLSSYPFEVKGLLGKVSDIELFARIKEDLWIVEQQGSEFHRLMKLQVNHHPPVYDPESLANYSGLIYTRHLSDDVIEKYHDVYPSCLIMDEPAIPFRWNKIKINQLFDRNQRLKKYRPKWGVFDKKATDKVVTKINQTVGSDWYVIKPNSVTSGCGVIVLKKESLKSTLKYIFSKSEKLGLDPDMGYRYWMGDNSSSFIVEEFVPSLVVYPPQFGARPYNPTMRVSFFAYQDNGKIDIFICGGWWKLPRKSLDDSGTLNEKYKNKSGLPNFMAVDPEVWEGMQEPLRESLTLFYQEMLAR